MPYSGALALPITEIESNRRLGEGELTLHGSISLDRTVWRSSPGLDCVIAMVLLSYDCPCGADECDMSPSSESNR